MIKVGNDWDTFLAKETSKPYFNRLERWLAQEENKYVIYPNKENRYKAFEITPFSKIRVVLCAPEPYCYHNMADGLSYSSLFNMTPALSNLYRKIEDELGIVCDKENTDLTRWAQQGVFLLNMSLTIQAGKPLSHRNRDWYQLTYNAIKELYEDESPKVFILLGNSMNVRGFAMKNEKPHLILLGSEPQFSNFFYKNYFKEANDFLFQTQRGIIDWR